MISLQHSGYECDSDQAYRCTSKQRTSDVITADLMTNCKSITHTFSQFSHGSQNPALSVYAEAPCIVLVQSVTLSETLTSTSLIPEHSNGLNATSDHESGSAGLSTGAKAAIGVCVPIFALLAGLVTFFLLRRRSRKAAVASSNSEDTAAMPDKSADDLANKAEMDGTDCRYSSPSNMTSERIVSLLSESSLATSQETRRNRTSELYGSLPSPRLHQDVVELPADTGLYTSPRN